MWRALVPSSVLLLALGMASPAAALPPPSTEVAVIGDFGARTPGEAAVARLVLDRDPTAIVTTGDNAYGSAGYQASVGRYYPRTNLMHAAIGNHDITDTGRPAFRAYFGPARRAVTIEGVAYLFVDSPAALADPRSMSRQRAWVKQRALASTARWQVVVLHHPPFSSGDVHGSTPSLQWPFGRWGVDLVLAGHDHLYERVERPGVMYVVNGAGGAALYDFGQPLAGSAVRADDGHGALFLRTTSTTLVGEFLTTDGRVIDRLAIPR